MSCSALVLLTNNIGYSRITSIYASIFEQVIHIQNNRPDPEENVRFKDFSFKYFAEICRAEDTSCNYIAGQGKEEQLCPYPPPNLGNFQSLLSQTCPPLVSPVTPFSCTFSDVSSGFNTKLGNLFKLRGTYVIQIYIPCD